MRYLNMFLACLMLLFIGVQINDPDGPMWMVIYAIPAVWTGIAAFRHHVLLRPVVNALLLLSIATAAAGTVYFWPRSARWWSMDVWYNMETAREGMGMMIVTIVLLVAWVSGRRSRQPRSSST